MAQGGVGGRVSSRLDCFPALFRQRDDEIKAINLFASDPDRHLGDRIKRQDNGFMGQRRLDKPFAKRQSRFDLGRLASSETELTHGVDHLILRRDSIVTTS